MADEAGKASSAPNLTARDLEILIGALRSPKSDGDTEVYILTSVIVLLLTPVDSG